MANAIIEKAKERFEQSHSSLAREFASIRAGRANVAILDGVVPMHHFWTVFKLNTMEQ